MKVKVAVNGYGTIGKRVADAVLKQDDMELIGVAKTRPNYEAFVAVQKRIPLYVPSGKEKDFEEKGLRVSGTIEELISRADVVVDATPSGVGAANKELYVKHGVKAIFQGGEKPNVAEVSFSSLCNYDEALGKSYVRVVSCNTTGILRALCTLNRYIGLEKARVFIVRRGADPKERDKGPINSVVLDPPKLPSHHGKDVLTVLRGIDILTAAVAVPTTLMHTHFVHLKLKHNASREDVLSAFSQTRRIMMIDSSILDAKSTSEIIEVARDLGRPRYDIPELIVWLDSITVNGDEVSFIQSVHQEAIVVPENIDAIRAVTSIESTAEASIRKTDESLGIGRWI
jgi:glyceraldehyde-3-phosphate dehydrogenase (NAD(P))